MSKQGSNFRPRGRWHLNGPGGSENHNGINALLGPSASDSDRPDPALPGHRVPISDDQIEGALVDLLVAWRGSGDRLDLASRMRKLVTALDLSPGADRDTPVS